MQGKTMPTRFERFYLFLASMRPLHECRGKPRTEPGGGEGAGAASMRPLHECRGKPARLDRRAFRAAGLQ